MPMYQAFCDFTAQGLSVRALMGMYADLERDPKRRIELTPVVVFLAFSIESYINSIGARKIQSWDELERLPWRAKVIVLHNGAQREPDWSRDPLQFAAEVFRLRDRLAHGKPERVVGEKTSNRAAAIRPLKSSGESLAPQWYKALTREWVFDAKKRFHSLMLYLGGLYDFHESDHLMMSVGGVLTYDDESDRPA